MHSCYTAFFNKEERTVFRQLISVSGIGANTASVMLSSMTVKEIAGAILTENVNAIKSVKGIGAEDGPAGDYRIER